MGTISLGEGTVPGADRRLTPPPRSPSGGLSRALVLGAVVIGLAVAGLLALALRDGSSGSTPLSPIAEAAERTGELGGVRFSGTGHMTASGMSMDMTFSGAFDTATDRARLEMRAQTPGARPPRHRWTHARFSPSSRPSATRARSGRTP